MTAPQMRLQSLVIGNLSLDVKFGEDRSIRHTFKTLNEIVDVTGVATEAELRGHVQIAALLTAGTIRLLAESAPGIVDNLSWGFQSNQARQYAAGFYEFSGDDNDFDPSIMWGTTAVGVAAHFMLVTGATPIDDVRITVSGTSISDGGVQTGGDSEEIRIPNGTVTDLCFETAKKWNGEVTVETTTGTAITCNYGWAKYFDYADRDFVIEAIEALWESDSTDSTSNITLIHHRKIGWTFNAGADPDPPVLADRNTDHAGNVTHQVGAGAWKRTELDTFVCGAESEGVLFRVDSGNLGVGTLSFRALTLELVVHPDETS